MVFCPKCGRKAIGQYCSNCGAYLGKKTGGPNPQQNFLLIGALLAIAIIVVMIGGASVLVLSGSLQSPSNISISLEKQNTCGNSLTYSVQLMGNNGLGVANQVVTTSVDGVTLENLKTDQNGRFTSTVGIQNGWCGKQINVSATYLGDALHKKTNATALSIIQIPTKIQINAPTEADSGLNVSINATLLSYDNSPVPNKTIIVSDGVLYNAITDNQGDVEISAVFNGTGLKTFKATFAGDEFYLPSESGLNEIELAVPTCNDGTGVGACSQNLSYYCNQQKQLVFDCSRCGCIQGLVCSDNQCITQEQQIGDLISQLQNSVVYVANSYATGSGIIIDHKNGQTVILTNRHVIEDASTTADVRMETRDQQSAYANDIKVAPFGMDFAVVYVNGIFGEPASINYSEQIFQGESVLALGSPLGIQGSVSKGIVSNFGKADTSFLPWASGSGYGYNTIQTDASVNPGNSGGGLFLTSDGDLIGVNEFGELLPSGQSAQGLNFAIDIKELQKLLPYDNWKEFIPIPRCYDGTEFGSCSTVQGGYFCSSGNLIPDCQTCGCPTGSLCPSSGMCFACPSGYTPNEDNNGNGFCCPVGDSAFVDTDGSGFCCPPGTSGFAGKICK